MSKIRHDPTGAIGQNLSGTLIQGRSLPTRGSRLHLQRSKFKFDFICKNILSEFLGVSDPSSINTTISGHPRCSFWNFGVPRGYYAGKLLVSWWSKVGTQFGGSVWRFGYHETIWTQRCSERKIGLTTRWNRFWTFLKTTMDQILWFTSLSKAPPGWWTLGRFQFFALVGRLCASLLLDVLGESLFVPWDFAVEGRWRCTRSSQNLSGTRVGRIEDKHVMWVHACKDVWNASLFIFWAKLGR